MEQTPLAVVIKTVANVLTVFVYFVSLSNRRLMRATKPLVGGEWIKKAVIENDSLDDSGDLAATPLQTGNCLSFMLSGNTAYKKIVDAV